jgi:hypothetical protein
MPEFWALLIILHDVCAVALGNRPEVATWSLTFGKRD